jgi:tetratricopeptide (TPR) repeat protein/DNA-binding MarR family transcriptional regulator
MGGQSFLPTEILDYVETHSPQEGSPYGVSQRELAKSLGYHPCSMSRPLESLVEEGLLSCRRGPVRDGIRKQLVYRLTETGRQRLARDTKRVPLVSAAIPPPPNPFIGRKDELDRLGVLSSEGGAVALINGAPGMGKTALISRHLRRARRGRIPFWFTVRPASSPRQFVTALSHALAFVGAPQLAYYSQLPRPPVAREVADLVGRALGDRELVTVIDDFQLADPDLRKFLGDFVVDTVRGRQNQVYVVGQETPELSAEGVRITHLTIGGLDRTAAHDLTDRRGGLAERFESVFQATLGSPLLLQLAVSNPGLEADAATLPARVVDRLSIEDVRALLPIAVANEPLPLGFVSETVGLSPARLAEVSRIGVVQKSTQGRVEILQVVRTALLRRVTSKDERVAHLALAEFYEGSHQPDAIRERFLHLVAANAWKLAARLLIQQQRSVLSLGYSETLRAGLRGLASASPRGPARVKVLLIEAEFLRLHSDHAEAIDTIREAIEESSGDPRVTCEGYLSIVDLLIRLRRVDDAVAQLKEAEKIGPVTRRIQVFLILSRARIVQAQGNIHTARDRFQEAFELARRFRISDLALEGIAGWSRLVELEGGSEPALRIIASALPEAQQAGRADIALNLRLIRAHAYMRMGQDRVAEEEMRLVRSEAESLGYLNQLTYSLSGLAAAATQESRWSDAVMYAKQACALAERLRNDLLLGHTLALLAAAESRQSENESMGPEMLHDSVMHGERSVEILTRLPPSESLGLAHGYLGESYLMSGDRVRATQHYNLAVEVLGKLRLFWLRDAIEHELGTKLGLASATSTEGGRPVGQKAS